MSLALGSQIGLFHLDEVLGSGAAGVVYRATHLQTKATVALKLVHESKEAFHRRVYVEMDTLRSIKHPNVVRIYAAGHDGPYAYIAMEYIKGVSLNEWVAEATDGADHLQRVLRAGAQMAGGLAAVHAAGVIHRDLKSENVLVDEENNIKLLDFGTARFVDSPDIDDKVAGTIRYMAPEQLAGTEVDRRADLFSLGVVLFELLCGRPPHVASDTARLILAQCTEPAPPIASMVKELPRSAMGLIDSLLALSPADRPRSASEVALRLTQALGEPLASFEETPVVLAARFVGRRKLVKDLVAQALASQGEVVALTGPPGIGLSRTLQEVRGEFLIRGGRPALVQGGPDVLFRVLDLLAGPLVGAEVRDRLLAEDRELLYASFPELRRDTTAPAKALPFQRVRLAVTRVLRRAAAMGPLMIAVDDAELAHPTDLRCMLGAGLILLSTHRPERLEIVGEPIEVLPMTPGVMAEMARSMIGADGATLAWEEAELLAGNPGHLTRRAHQWALSQMPAQSETQDTISDGTTWERAIEDVHSQLYTTSASTLLEKLAKPNEPEPVEPNLRYKLDMLRATLFFHLGNDRDSLIHATHAASIGPTDLERNRARLQGAQCALRRGHYGACLEEALYCKDQAKALGADNLLLSWWALEVSTLTRMGRIYEAQLEVDRCRSLLAAADPDGATPLRWAAASVATSLCEWNDALTQMGAIRETYKTRSAPRIEAGMYLEEGYLELRRGRPNRAAKLLKQAADDSLRMDDAGGRMAAQSYLSWAQMLIGERKQAFAAIDEVRQTADRIQSRIGEIRVIIVGLRYARLFGDDLLMQEMLERVDRLPPNWANEPAAALIQGEVALALWSLKQAGRAQRAIERATSIPVEDPHDHCGVRLSALRLRLLQQQDVVKDALDLAEEAQALEICHIARMAEGIAAHAGGPEATKALTQARRNGDLYAACFIGGTDQEAFRTAHRVGFVEILEGLEVPTLT